MDPTWPASAAVVALMVAQAHLAKRQLGGWLAPGALFSLAWATGGALCLLLAPDLRIWPGILWIFFMTCTAHLGNFLILPAARPAIDDQVTLRQSPAFPYALGALFASTILGIAGVLYLVSTAGEGPASLFSLSGLSRIAATFAGARYTDPDYNEPSLFLALETFTYLSGYFGGLVFAQSGSRLRGYAAFVPAVPAILTTLVLGARTAAGLVGLSWIATYLALRVYMGDRAPWHNFRRLIVGLAVSIAVFTAFYVFVQAIRMDVFNPIYDTLPGGIEDREAVVVEYGIGAARIQYVGYIATFSEWLSENWDVWEPPHLGLYSFDGPAGWLGYRVDRNFEEIQISPDPNIPTTNIYSLFRTMAFDWTIPGSAAVLLLVTAVAGLADRRVRAGSIAFVPLVALFYQQALYLTSSVMRHTVTDGAWLMFAIYLWLDSSPRNVQDENS
jgi:hypothetical protein